MRKLSPVLFLLLAILLSACGAAVEPVIPTDRPTVTPTNTPTLTRTPGFNATPTIAPTNPPVTGTGGPSPTPLFGPTQPPVATQATATRQVNPNAPRIEFFTSDVLQAAPGSQITLFWSTRGVDNAAIYRVDTAGVRTQVWNVPSDGSLPVQLNRRDRIRADFVLSVGEGALRVEQSLSVPLSCPDAWFFEPGPQDCPEAPAQETQIITQEFERGRMIYVNSTNIVYVLFNDGRPPAWIVFENRYDPETHPESEPSFVPPPDRYQPVRVLGFVWRGNDVVRNRLGLGLAPEEVYLGFVQASATGDGSESLFISSDDGTVLQLVPGGEAWQIITAP